MRPDLVPNHVRGPLRVAAKAGFLTKRIWSEFFSTGNKRWRNRRWKSLMEMGLFHPVPDYGFIGSAVTLSGAGKALVVNLNMDPVYSPPAKNLWHDEELIRLALFLERQGWVSNWMTEQELKVSGRSEQFFRDQVRAIKIPDLIIKWNVPNENIFWAIELERTRKEVPRYYEMVGAYKGISKIDSVLVITATETIETNIKKAQAKMEYPQSKRPMLFASMAEVIRDPGSSELRHGASRITLAKMGQGLTGKKYIKPATEGKGPSPELSPAGALPERVS